MPGLAIKILASQPQCDLAKLKLRVAGCRPSMSDSRTQRSHGRAIDLGGSAKLTRSGLTTRAGLDCRGAS
jgi:hypothetical protein